MRNRYYAIIVLLLSSPPLPAAQISLSSEQPVRGETVDIQLETPDTVLIIAYRPNSSVVRRDTLRSEESTDVFPWTPRRAGVVALSTTTASHNVSVRFAGLSWKGLIVMLLAGTILFGGVIFAFRVLFREKESGQSIDVDPTTRPDT